MSQELQHLEEQTERMRSSLGRVLDGGLEGVLAAQGVTLTGFSVRIQPFDVLLVLRGHSDEDAVVCFVGSSDVPSCFLKADAGARNHSLQWREDRFAR